MSSYRKVEFEICITAYVYGRVAGLFFSATLLILDLTSVIRGFSWCCILVIKNFIIVDLSSYERSRFGLLQRSCNSCNESYKFLKWDNEFDCEISFITLLDWRCKVFSVALLNTEPGRLQKLSKFCCPSLWRLMVWWRRISTVFWMLTQMLELVRMYEPVLDACCTSVQNS